MWMYKFEYQIRNPKMSAFVIVGTIHAMSYQKLDYYLMSCGSPSSGGNVIISCASEAFTGLHETATNRQSYDRGLNGAVRMWS